VVAADPSAALKCYVHLDEPRHDQPAALLVPGLDPARRYRVTEVTPGERLLRLAGQEPLAQASGAALAGIGLAIQAQQPLTAAVILIEAG
jgi:hypothetical protein